jgi:hypothetical protein
MFRQLDTNRTHPLFESGYDIVKDFSLFGKKFILGNDSSSIGATSGCHIPKSAKVRDNGWLSTWSGVKMHHTLDSNREPLYSIAQLAEQDR